MKNPPLFRYRIAIPLILFALLLGMLCESVAQDTSQSLLRQVWKNKQKEKLPTNGKFMSPADLQAVSQTLRNWVGPLPPGSSSTVKNSPIRGLMTKLKEQPAYLSEQMEQAKRWSGWKIRRHARYHTPTFIDIPAAKQRLSLKASSSAPSDQHALAFIDANRALFRLDNPRDELTLVEKVSDRLGKHHVKFRQTYQGIPVWGHDLVVHLEPNQQ